MAIFNSYVKLPEGIPCVGWIHSSHRCAKLQRPAPATPMEQSLHHLAPEFAAAATMSTWWEEEITKHEN